MKLLPNFLAMLASCCRPAVAPQAGTGALEKQGHFASAPFPGYKAGIWDGGHRVPMSKSQTVLPVAGRC